MGRLLQTLPDNRVSSLVAPHEKVRKHLKGKRDMTSFAQELDKYFIVAMKESVV